MQNKLIRLEAIADAAHAQLRQCADNLRTARDEFNALDRHRENLEAKKFGLSAPERAKHAELSARVAYLADEHDDLRADHRAKRDLFIRCKRFADAETA